VESEFGTCCSALHDLSNDTLCDLRSVRHVAAGAMNNEQFRRLVASSPGQQNGSVTPKPGATPALGAKKSSFIPMTPRNIGGGGGGVDFARQVRERNIALKPTKKFRSSAPKGSKYGAEYTDRAKARAEGGNAEDDKAERIKALEEQMKLDQISPETFYALRDQITGGDVSSTHLVKGLDFQLLERVRRGEDVMGIGSGEASGEAPSEDVEGELDKLGEKEIEAVKKEKAKKQGSMAPPPPVAGKKRTRDELMAELKAQRLAAAAAREAAQPKLNDRWTKVGDKKKPKIEIDEKGREVLTTVDENGVVKRRVRKVPVRTEQAKAAMGAPDASKAILGADTLLPVPANVEQSPVEDDEDDDIFEGVGTDYNPLANAEDDEDDSDDSDDENVPLQPKVPKVQTDTSVGEGSEPEEDEVEPATASQPEERSVEAAPKLPASRNYFGNTVAPSDESKQDHLAGIQEVLKKAAKMDPLRSGESNENSEEAAAEQARLKKRAQMLANEDRDLEDMDMGFGSSRFEDGGEEDGDGKKMKLSEWKGGAEDGWEEDGSKGDGKKKRKPKKRKGDANSIKDIMGVIEGRKSGGAK